jgi:hypothetical protein
MCSFSKLVDGQSLKKKKGYITEYYFRVYGNSEASYSLGPYLQPQSRFLQPTKGLMYTGLKFASSC